MRDRPLAVSNRLWLISDTHFGHDNIVKYQQRPTNHEVIMASEWIRRVGEDDQILHLGDVAFGRGGRIDRWLDVIGRLPGEKFLILGNHDDPERYDYTRAGFTIIPEFVYKRIAFSHRPVVEDRYDDEGNDWLVNIHGHTHGNPWTAEHDGIALHGREYRNLSVELTGLAPVRLGNVYPIERG